MKRGADSKKLLMKIQTSSGVKLLRVANVLEVVVLVLDHFYSFGGNASAQFLSPSLSLSHLWQVNIYRG